MQLDKRYLEESIQQIGYARNPLGWNHEKQWIIAEVRRKGWHRDLLKSEPAECVYGIWKHRNDVIFNKVSMNSQIWKDIIYDTFVRGSLHKVIKHHININNVSIVH